MIIQRNTYFYFFIVLEPVCISKIKSFVTAIIIANTSIISMKFNYIQIIFVVLRMCLSWTHHNKHCHIIHIKKYLCNGSLLLFILYYNMKTLHIFLDHFLSFLYKIFSYSDYANIRFLREKL